MEIRVWYFLVSMHEIFSPPFLQKGNSERAREMVRRLDLHDCPQAACYWLTLGTTSDGLAILRHPFD